MPQTNQNKVGILFPNGSTPVYDSLWALGNRVGGSWIFTKASRFPAVAPLHKMYPRPAGEVSSFASHLWAHSTMDYSLELNARGGVWPYRWQITSGPAGATIGETLSTSSVGGLTLHSIGSDYGKITWSGAKSGSHAFVVTCTDQVGSVVTYNFTVTVDDTKFVFLDSTAADDTGAGTLAAPKKTFQACWVSGFGGRTLVIKNGTYSATESGDAFNIGLNNSNRPTAIIAFTGHSPVLTMNSLFRDGGTDGSANDFLLRGITLNQPRSEENIKVLFFSGTQNRVKVQSCTFSNVGVGTNGGDNPGSIVFFEASGRHTYTVVTDCVLASTCQTQLCVYFKTDYALFENNRSTGTTIGAHNGDTFINAKGGSGGVQACNHITHRANSYVGNCNRGVYSFMNQGLTPVDQECCWNISVNTGGPSCSWNAQNFDSGGAGAGPMHMYANSFSSPATAVMWGTFPDIIAQGNAIVSVPPVGAYQDGITDDSAANFTFTAITDQVLSAAQLSATGTLTGTGTTYRLTHGAELFSS